MSWIGFKVYVHKHYGVTNLHQYKANRNNVYVEYSPILEGIDAIIYEDQLTGALVGIYKQGIVARKLSLPENKNEIIVKEIKVGFE